MIPVSFLVLTFAISLTGFACILAIPPARSPDTAIGLPFWLIMVWGPSLAAIILSARNHELLDLLSRTIKVSTVPWEAWGLVLAPLVILLLIKPFTPGEAPSIGAGLVAGMIGFNLILGPLGEELGWRGLFQEQLNQRIGWLEASLLIGIIWLVWHLPLWTIDSPHAQIALPLFAAHCMLYSVIIGAAYTISGGSILPAILIHLTVNLAANLALFVGFRDPNAWFSASLIPLCLLALCAIGLVYARTGLIGIRWLQM
ncbi:CPBP family intramembrane glutamic endopeptidase [Pelagibacterium halotolerans]|uniref:CPBP family intramembrane glutamic endopeptidase n=1 Tax=Pelagibacterium halotolerans TaxID=531813 RepID=UPI0038507322